MDWERVYRLDLAQGELGRPRTSHDALVARATLTRTGVFPYRMPDGSTRRELRHPDEVFAPDALASFDGAPVTIDHPGRVDATNWKAHAVGHTARGVERTDDYVAGDVFLSDKKAQAAAEKGEVSEISCGYQCSIDPTPGEYKGEKYDAVQRNIRINHVALGPKNWGRMGPGARLHLDSGCAISGEGNEIPRFDRVSVEEQPMPMTAEEKAAYDKAIADAAKAQADLAMVKQDDAAELAKLRAANELLTKQNDKFSSEATAKKDAAEVEARVQAIVELRDAARRVQSKGVLPKDWKADGKTADVMKREIAAALLARDEIDMTVDSLEGAALDKVYEIALKRFDKVEKANGDLRTAVTTTLDMKGGDDDEEPDADKARKAFEKREYSKGKKDRRRGDRRRDHSSAPGEK